jgi:hypothetical protein
MTGAAHAVTSSKQTFNGGHAVVDFAVTGFDL